MLEVNKDMQYDERAMVNQMYCEAIKLMQIDHRFGNGKEKSDGEKLPNIDRTQSMLLVLACSNNEVIDES